MNVYSGEQLIPGRSHTAAGWQALMSQALLTGNDGRPGLEQSLTRLHYLDDAFIPVAEWDELEWLVQEAQHFHERRQAKHPLWKWKSRHLLQNYSEDYFARSAIKATAILRVLDERFLLLRGRAIDLPATSTTPPPSWHAVEQTARLFHAAATNADVWATAQLLDALVPHVRFLLGTTHWLESDPDAQERTSEALSHFSWHAREVSDAVSPKSAWKRARQADEANRLALISLEQLNFLLRRLRLRLVRWDSGWTGDT